jgi:small subunit ribosomal protein S7
LIKWGFTEKFEFPPCIFKILIEKILEEQKNIKKFIIYNMVTAGKYAKFVEENSTPVQEKFINVLMRGGKKNTARKVFKTMLERIKKASDGKNTPEEIFELAINNVKPRVEVKAKRIGGSVYQIPVEVAPKRQQTLAIRWILANVRKGKGKPIAEKLATEILAAAKNEGSSVKKREDVQKMAEANKAYAHFARY